VGTGDDQPALMVLRVWLPDRPGALGLVASRIGALGADIVGVDVLERSEHVAVDEFAIALPRAELVRLLVREVEEVDGASVEEWRFVERFPDPRLDALVSVEDVCAALDLGALYDVLTRRVREEFEADWTAVLAGGEVVASSGGEVPPAVTLAAIAVGAEASPLVAAGSAGPDDLAVAPLREHDATMFAGRAGHPFRTRERRQLLALARIADRVAVLLAGRFRASAS
jgi:hypothetical protein